MVIGQINYRGLLLLICFVFAFVLSNCRYLSRSVCMAYVGGAPYKNLVCICFRIELIFIATSRLVSYRLNVAKLLHFPTEAAFCISEIDCK
jgi:hypothetical protein